MKLAADVVHRTKPRRRTEGGMRRDLLHDEDRRSRRQVGTEADAESEQETRREPVGAAGSCDQAEEESGGRPDDDVHHQRNGGTPFTGGMSSAITPWKRYR